MGCCAFFLVLLNVRMFFGMSRLSFLGFAVFFLLLLFIIYVSGVSRSVYGGDSGDVILAAWFGGVAHPPGYPLNSIIGYFFTHLPFTGSIAYKAGVMMALFSAGTVVFLFLIIQKLLSNFYIALAASLSFAFSALFWFYTHTVEVFQLNLLLVSVSTYFLILWRSKVIEIGVKHPEKQTGFLFAAFFFLGLAVFHHQTAVLLVPAFMYLAKKTYKPVLGLNRNSLFLLAFFLFGAAPYVIVPFLASMQPPINWDNAINVGNFVRLISRADYGTFAASPNFVGALFKARLLQVLSYAAFVRTDFTIAGSVFALVGGYYLFIKQRIIFWFLLLAFMFSGPFFLVYSSFTLSSDFLFGIWERFLLLSYFFVAICISYGFKAILDIVRGLKLKSFSIRKEILLVFITGSFFLLPLYVFANNLHKVDMSNFKLGDWLGHDVLVSTKPGSLIFLFDDTVAFNTQYVYYTNPDFSDRKIVMAGILRRKYYREQLVRQYPSLNIPDGFLDTKEKESGEFMAELINANLGQVPIYTVEFSPKIEGHAWQASGLLLELVDEGEVLDRNSIKKAQQDTVNGFLYDLDGLEEYTHFIPQNIKRFYGYSYNNLGDLMMNYEYYGDAKAYYGLAQRSKNDDPRAYVGLARSSIKLGDCTDAKFYSGEAYLLDQKNIPVVTTLSSVARVCDKDEELAKRYEAEVERLRRSFTNPF